MVLCTQIQAKVKEQNGELLPEPLYCRSWGCDICRKRRAKELRWLGRAGEPTSFLTLTVNPQHYDGPDHRARQLCRAWRRLRYAMRKRWPSQDFPFLAVFESTQKGEPHLHVLFRGPFVPQEWISDHMARLIGAPVVDVRYVRDQGRAAAYVAKYLAKAPHVWDGCKRYWRSQNWQLWPDDVAPKLWTRLWLCRRGIDQIYEDIRTTGISVCETIGGGQVTFGWWTNSWRASRE